MNPLIKKDYRRSFALSGALAGALIFLLLYGTAVLNPTYDGWIINGYDEPDLWQHYAGWTLFRNSDWAFPLGTATNIHYPDGSTITYVDGTPWVAIFFKLFRNFLPETFQWYGIYTLVCFMLQGAAGALLGSRGLTHNKAARGIAFLSGLLFACIPSLWDRAFRHVALSSQWLLLWALYACLEYRDSFRAGQTRRPLLLCPLATLAVGIHPYYLPMVMMCAAVAMVDCFRYTGRRVASVGQFLLPSVTALIGGWICGAFQSSGSMSRYGYGLYSMNVNAIINTTSVGGYEWSKVFKPIPNFDTTQNDGFNYLGLGILVLLAAALLLSLVRLKKDPDAAKAWWKRNWVFFCACVFMSCFAVSNRICIGTFEIFIPIPWQLEALCAIFRASGRMFYFVTACMLLYGIYTLRSNAACISPRWQLVLVMAVLLVTVGLQLWDTSAVAEAKRGRFTAQAQDTLANGAATAGIGEDHSVLVCTSLHEDDAARKLGILAGREGMATNSYLSVAGGNYPGCKALAEQAAADLAAGQYNPDYVYVSRHAKEYAAWQVTFADDPNVQLVESHGCYFLIP